MFQSVPKSSEAAKQPISSQLPDSNREQDASQTDE